MKQKYKAIVVVLASQDEDVKNTRYVVPRLLPEWEPMYSVFKDIWEQYCESEPQLKTIFVYGGGPKSFTPKEHDWIYEDVFENNHPGMITKNMRAFADIDEKYDYDFIVRTNLSTFWDFPKLMNRLNSMPTEKCMAGTPIRIKDLDGTMLEYLAGYDLIISRDIVKELIKHSEEVITQPVLHMMEDLSMCTTANRYIEGITNLETGNHRAFQFLIKPFSQEEYNRRYQAYLRDNFDHVRAKTRTDRNLDKQILHNLLYNVYGKTILPRDNASSSIG